MFFTNIYDVAVQYTLVYTSEPESDGDIYMVKVYKISNIWDQENQGSDFLCLYGIGSKKSLDQKRIVWYTILSGVECTGPWISNLACTQ